MVHSTRGPFGRDERPLSIPQALLCYTYCPRSFNLSTWVVLHFRVGQITEGGGGGIKLNVKIYIETDTPVWQRKVVQVTGNTLKRHEE